MIQKQQLIYPKEPIYIIAHHDLQLTLAGITGITYNMNAITKKSTLNQIGLMKLGSAGTNIGTLQFYTSTNTDYLQITNSVNSSTISTNGTVQDNYY